MGERVDEVSENAFLNQSRTLSDLFVLSVLVVVCMHACFPCTLHCVSHWRHYSTDYVTDLLAYKTIGLPLSCKRTSIICWLFRSMSLKNSLWFSRWTVKTSEKRKKNDEKCFFSIKFWRIHSHSSHRYKYSIYVALGGHRTALIISIPKYVVW